MNIKVTFRDESDFVMKFESGVRARPPDIYDGAYVIVPRVTAQVLGTAGKLMTDDVEIEKIPLSEASNLEGGITATIG